MKTIKVLSWRAALRIVALALGTVIAIVAFRASAHAATPPQISAPVTAVSQAIPGTGSVTNQVSATTQSTGNQQDTVARQPVTSTGSPPSVSISSSSQASSSTNASASVSGNAGGNSVSNSTTLPLGASANSCAYGGVNVAGSACGSSGSATAVAYAPTTAQISSSPSSTTSASVAGQSIANTISVPASAGASACPSAGVNVSGYGCGSNGSATAVAFSPASGNASAAPSSKTDAAVAGNNLHNDSTIPVHAGASTCPLVGVDVTGYGCGNPGSADAVAFAPTTVNGSAAPRAKTNGTVAGNRVHNDSTVPVGAGAATCPLIGIGVSGYGCGSNGSGTAVVSAPTSTHAGATPSANTDATAAGHTVNNNTSAPLAGSAATCPVIGLNITGYGCGNPGSATALVTAPTTGNVTTSPSSTTAANVAGNSIVNSTSVPTSVGVATCPVIGLNITGYGCENPGSATALVTAPTMGSVTTSPSTTTAANLAGNSIGNSTNVPTSAGVATCPVIGVNITGYGCENPGSATALVTAPTMGSVASSPSTTTAANIASNSIGSSAGVPTNAGVVTCPVVGVNVSGYGCGSPASNGGSTGGGLGAGSGSGSGSGSASGSGGGSNGGANSGSGGPQVSGQTPSGALPTMPLAPVSLATPAGTASLPAIPPSGQQPVSSTPSGLAARPATGPGQSSQPISTQPASPAVYTVPIATKSHPVVEAAFMTGSLSHARSAAAQSAGIASMPRTGGAGQLALENRITDPLLPIVIAILLLAFGAFTRRFAFQKL